MQRLDQKYIFVGLIWLIVGMIFGAWLGASHHNNFADTHAHINLLGFVTSVLFGFICWAYPTVGKAGLTIWQFAIYEIGIALLIIGKILVDNDGTETLFLQIGATLAIIGAAMMLYLFARNSYLA